jgi:hypothetical protein
MKKEIKVVINPDLCSVDDFSDYFLTGLALQQIAESCNYDAKLFTKFIFTKIQSKEFLTDFDVKKFVNELTLLPFDLEETDKEVLFFVRRLQQKYITVPLKFSVNDFKEFKQSKLN